MPMQHAQVQLYACMVDMCDMHYTTYQLLRLPVALTFFGGFGTSATQFCFESSSVP